VVLHHPLPDLVVHHPRCGRHDEALSVARSGADLSERLRRADRRVVFEREMSAPPEREAGPDG
jgi:hypothetical protein